MQIAIVYETTYPEFKGGVERWYSELSQGLAREGLEVTYLNTIGRNGRLNNVNFLPLSDSRRAYHLTGKRSIGNVLKYAFGVFKNLRKFEFDAVYLSSFPYLHIWAAKLAQVSKKKKCIIYVEWFELPSPRFWKMEFGKIPGVIGLAIQTATIKLADVNVTYLDSMTSKIGKMQSKKSNTIKLPGICMEETDLETYVPDLNENDICQIGRLTSDKQPLVSLNVIKELKESGWSGTFHLIGSGPLLEKSRQFVELHGLANFVSIYPNAEDNLKNEILRKSAILMHPSKREGFGLAIVEAAAFGVPAILIRGEDNRSTELCINSSLVADTNDTQSLVKLVQQGITERLRYFQECQEWNTQVRPKMMASSSVLELAKILRTQ